jgi:thiamine biosynthesis lipoprotein
VEEQHMGTTYRIVAYAIDEAVGKAAIARAFARIDELDARLSDYRSDSELMQLCSTAPHARQVDVSDDLWRVLRQSTAVSDASDGAFDVTVGSLTKLWRRARRQHELPPAELLQEAMKGVDYKSVIVDAQRPRVALSRAGMRIDLGGIAKGFASEEALRILHSAGISQALIDAGGGLALGAPPPGEQGWKVGVASLIEGQPPAHFLSLHDCSVATSGDLWQFVEIDGVRYSHILDPKTGMGLTYRISATVVARDGGTADALATAVCVLGPERGKKLAEQFDADVIVMTLDNDEVQQTISPELNSKLQRASKEP